MPMGSLSQHNGLTQTKYDPFPFGALKSTSVYGIQSLYAKNEFEIR